MSPSALMGKPSQQEVKTKLSVYGIRKLENYGKHLTMRIMLITYYSVQMEKRSRVPVHTIRFGYGTQRLEHSEKHSQDMASG